MSGGSGAVAASLGGDGIVSFLPILLFAATVYSKLQVRVWARD